jgi:murein DD-endopeptidase MepM/ murein hydrolase activator NlpD
MRWLAVILVFVLVSGCVNNPLDVTTTTLKETYPVHASNFSTQKLLWPIDCKIGVNCSVLYPDIDGDGKASCGSPSYAGHEGTDIVISWEFMDKGVDVYAAMNGRILWVFDGKYDRCANFGMPLGIKITDNPDCNDPAEPPQPGTSSGYRVCTESGDYCNAALKAEGKTSNVRCFWCVDGGNVVVILHTNSTSDMNNSRIFATRYDHLKNGSILVKPGDYVVAGQKIAEVGSAGRTSGPHLHFEVWSDYYKPIDPWSPSCGPNESLWQY